MAGFMRMAGWTAALFGSLLLLASASLAAPSVYPMFQAEVMLQTGKKASRPVGRAMSAGGFSRLDVRTAKAGDFSVIVDMDGMRMKVASHALKAYVEIPLEGRIDGWRDIVRCAAAYVLPQSLGMMDVREAQRRDKGAKTLRGYRTRHLISVFETVFMGIRRSFELETWENDTFFPFPMQAASPETADTWGGRAWLAGITADEAPGSAFALPGGYTRYGSAIDLVLYALASF